MIPGDCNGLHEISWNYKGLHLIIRDCKLLPGIELRLHEIILDCK